MTYLLRIQQIPGALLQEIIPNDLAHAAYEELKGSKRKRGKNTGISTDPLTETGTRHNQMRSIAVYLRTQGHSREACRKAMLEWYEAQDPALIRSDRETVLHDMEEMLDWVFSERFELRTSGLRKQISLSSADARMIASAACRSQKRILFLLTVLCRGGLSAISYVEIAQLIGTSRNAVANSILKLLASGKIQRHIGGHYLTADEHYGTERNQYTVSFCKQMRDESTAEFFLGEVKENFDASYIRCMELLTDQEKRQYFSSKELAEMTGVQEKALIRIDLEGQPHIFQSDVYGMLVAYEYDGVRYYPLLDVVKFLRVNQPRTIVQRCKEKKLFAIPVGRQIAGKGFVDAACLRGILERSKSTEKRPLMDWLLNEEEWK